MARVCKELGRADFFVPGKDVIQLIEKFERTIDRVLHNEELSPPCLEYFLKKMLVVFTKGLLLKTYILSLFVFSSTYNINTNSL